MSTATPNRPTLEKLAKNPISIILLVIVLLAMVLLNNDKNLESNEDYYDHYTILIEEMLSEKKLGDFESAEIGGFVPGMSKVEAFGLLEWDGKEVKDPFMPFGDAKMVFDMHKLEDGYLIRAPDGFQENVQYVHLTFVDEGLFQVQYILREKLVAFHYSGFNRYKDYPASAWLEYISKINEAIESKYRSSEITFYNPATVFLRGNMFQLREQSRTNYLNSLKKQGRELVEPDQLPVTLFHGVGNGMFVHANTHITTSETILHDEKWDAGTPKDGLISCIKETRIVLISYIFAKSLSEQYEALLQGAVDRAEKHRLIVEEREKENQEREVGWRREEEERKQEEIKKLKNSF